MKMVYLLKISFLCGNMVGNLRFFFGNVEKAATTVRSFVLPCQDVAYPLNKGMRFQWDVFPGKDIGVLEKE